MSDAASRDRFSQGTRNIIGLAKTSVMKYRHTHITPEHILIGLLEAGSKQVARLIASGTASPDQVYQLVKAHLRPGTEPVPENLLNFSERAKRVIESAREEAVRGKAPQIAPEHLLLGLLNVSNTVCGAVLRAVGLESDAVRSLLLSEAQSPDES